MSHDELIAHLVLVGFTAWPKRFDTYGVMNTWKCRVSHGCWITVREERLTPNATEDNHASRFYVCLVGATKKCSYTKPERAWLWVKNKL